MYSSKYKQSYGREFSFNVCIATSETEKLNVSNVNSYVYINTYVQQINLAYICRQIAVLLETVTCIRWQKKCCNDSIACRCTHVCKL